MVLKFNFLKLNSEPNLYPQNDLIECVDDTDMNQQLQHIYGVANILRENFFTCSKAVKNCLFRAFSSCFMVAIVLLGVYIAIIRLIVFMLVITMHTEFYLIFLVE